MIEARPTTPADVAFGYRLLLGREPESPAVLEDKSGHPLDVMLAGLAASDEFATGVAAPLLDGRAPDLRYPGVPGEADTLWARTALGVTRQTAAALERSRTWRDLLLALAADPLFGGWIDSLGTSWSRPALLAGLERWSPFDAAAARADEDWGESVAERDAAIRHDVSARLRLGAPPAAPDDDARPLISVLMPVYQSPLEHLARAIDSVRGQSFTGWELILVDDGSRKSTVRSMLQAYAALDPRIRPVLLDANAGIAAASNAGLGIARGAWLALLDHDDMLTRDALEHVAEAVDAEGEVDLLYSDECLIDEADVPTVLYPKPDWSPLLMLNMHYIGHLTVHRTALVRELGGFRSEFDFSQDYDLALRVAERARGVRHIERILYGWRQVEGSAAAGGKDFARASNVAALQAAVDRRGWNGFVEALPTANRVRRRPSPPPRVAIVIPSDDAANITAAVRSILARTWYEAFEVLVVTNPALIARLRATLADPRLRWVAYDKPFNFSDKCNAGAAAAADGGADQLVFFNDDVRVVTPDWIDSLLEVATLPGVGAVGAKLLYEDGTVQHAGMVTGVRRLIGTAFHKRPADSHELFNQGVQSVREVSLLCAALVMTPAALFRDLGGFDAERFPVAHSDTDLGLRIRERGLSLVYTPHAVLNHIGHASIGAEERAAAATAPPKDKADLRLLRRFAGALSRDPYFPDTVRGLHHLDSQARFRLHPATGAPAREDARDVLIVSHELTLSGAPILVRDMVRVLRARGDNVVVASRRDGPMRGLIQAEGAPVIVDSRLFDDEPAVFDFGRNFDLVIANTVVSWPVVRLLAAAVPTYWYLQEVELITRMAREQPLLAQTFAMARELWAPSRLCAEAVEPFGATARLLPYGVDDAGLSPGSGEGGRLRVCVLGAYEARKGQDLALAAWRRLAPPLRAGAELVFWGRELDRELRAELVRGAEATENVRVEGELPHADALQALRGSDVVLIPSREESMSLVALDGLSAGKAVVCSRRVGASAYLEDGVSGLVCEEPTPEALAALLARTLADGRLRADLGRAARAVFEREFTHEAFARRLEALALA